MKKFEVDEELLNTSKTEFQNLYAEVAVVSKNISEEIVEKEIAEAVAAVRSKKRKMSLRA